MVDEKLRPSFGTGERVPVGGEQDLIWQAS